MDKATGNAWTRLWEATFARKNLEHINRKKGLVVQKIMVAMLVLMAIIAVVTFLPFPKGG